MKNANRSGQEISRTARDLARDYFLRPENTFGCAESTYATLKNVYELPDAEDTSAAMVLNGGIAYSGGMCGAISGAAMAVGQLAERRLGDHNAAKRFARRMIVSVLEAFRGEFGSHECSRLIDFDISVPEDHDRFIDSGVWRTVCMRQIEFVVERLSLLKEPQTWDSWVSRLK